MTDRAVSPAIGVVLLVAITVIAAITLGMGVLQFTPAETPPARFTLSSDSTTGTITLTHRGGHALDPESLRLRIAINGKPIIHQPPIPFFAADGFQSGPTGPFNAAYEGNWTAGESASVRLASTNTPLQPGDRITVRLYQGETQIVMIETS